jgi:hypothetical protein
MSNLIPTIVGGMLAIIGGFLATCLTKLMTNRADKRKIIREKLEEIYSLINEMEDNLNSSLIRINELVVEPSQKFDAQYATVSLFKEMISYTHKIEMIAHLYLPYIAKDADSYCHAMINCLDMIISAFNKNEDVQKVVTETFEITESEHKKIQDALTKTVSKHG